MSRFIRPSRLLPLGIILLASVYAALVPFFSPEAVDHIDLAAVYLPPGAEHFFGTDQLGRDVWVRAAAALRLSMLLAVASALSSTLLGVLAGTLAATAGGLVDRFITRLVDSVNAIPHLLLGVVVLALWPGQGWAIILSIALTHWTQVARIVRARLLAEREAGYVKLALASGARPLALWCTHLIPAVLPQAGIALVLQLPHAIWHESALSFLGVGLPPQSASLGLLLEDARAGILVGAWWMLVFPAGLLVLLSWSFASLAHPQPQRRRPAGRRVSRSPQQQGGPAGRVDGQPVPQSAGLVVQGLSVWSEDGAGERTMLLDNINFTATAGAVNVVMGASGAGKTMLLRAAAGLLPESLDSTGSVLVPGTTGGSCHAPKLGEDLVFIPGSAATALNPVLRVGTALRRVRRRHGLDSSAATLAAVFKEFELAPELLRRYPHELSGGQAQRVVLALGLAARAGCVVLDEPTSALDADTAAAIARILRRVADTGCTIVMVTHDADLAAELADTLTVVSDGQVLDDAASAGQFIPELEGSAP
ncbi:peptide/nickel transport system permease protein [Arthrobacter sp. AG1021]|uniref:ABC transporter permease subunit n=1 Tax=Arthrobacter sp. AG1021 TaxID=2183908 RepID=UPI000F18995D|nr:ABC transporter permease subunit [Arthrobacter sp. AG1021]RKS22811.1 peptide/nickel transport system permease protein [Arthrobacter sp. AG1021]